MEKLMALFSHSLAGLIMAKRSCASLIIISFTDVPFVVCADPEYLNWSTSFSMSYPVPFAPVFR